MNYLCRVVEAHLNVRVLVSAAVIFVAHCGPVAADGASSENILKQLNEIKFSSYTKTAALSLLEATAKIKGIAVAQTLLEALKSRHPEPELREKLAAACADLSNYVCAHEEAAKISEFNWRMRTLGQIASAYAEQGASDAARASFASILSEIAKNAPLVYRDQLLVGTFNSVVEFGFLDLAIDAAEQVTNLSWRAEGLMVIASAAARLGNRSQAEGLFEKGNAILSTPAAAPNFPVARAAVAAFSVAKPTQGEALFARVGDESTRSWTAAQVAILLRGQGAHREADEWETKVLPTQKSWLEYLKALAEFKQHNCDQAIKRSRAISAQTWAAAALLQLSQLNQKQKCADWTVIRESAVEMWQKLGPETSPDILVLVGSAMAMVLAEAEKRNDIDAMPVGRRAWKCSSKAIIYPGWWDQESKDLLGPGDPTSTDGTRAAGPSVVKLGKGTKTRYYLYYMGEEKPVAGNVGKSRILRVDLSGAAPADPKPGNVSLEFYGPEFPPGDAHVYGTGYFKMGPFYGSVTPALDENGEPARSSDGALKPWFMYIATAGNNTGLAISQDGGITFQIVEDGSINPLFPFEIFPDPSGKPGYRRHPLEARSKIYDQSGSGSATVIRSADGKYHLFYTARMWNYYSYEDLGVTARDVSHPSGHIPDQGIAYAVSDDGIHWTRHTSMGLRVKSSAAHGIGRLVDPRFFATGDGEFEYSVTRPMVFEDGRYADGKPRFRMLVSSHSRTYRVRSLHSSDLLNWTWDWSPSEGLFGFGEKGTFDDQSNSYASCVREAVADGADEYRCWYTGNRYGHVSAGSTGIGYCSTIVPRAQSEHPDGRDESGHSRAPRK